MHGLRLLSTATLFRFRQEHHTTSGSQAPRRQGRAEFDDCSSWLVRHCGFHLLFFVKPSSNTDSVNSGTLFIADLSRIFVPTVHWPSVCCLWPRFSIRHSFETRNPQDELVAHPTESRLDNYVFLSLRSGQLSNYCFLFTNLLGDPVIEPLKILDRQLDRVNLRRSAYNLQRVCGTWLVHFRTVSNLSTVKGSITSWYNFIFFITRHFTRVIAYSAHRGSQPRPATSVSCMWIRTACYWASLRFSLGWRILIHWGSKLRDWQIWSQTSMAIQS